MRSLSALPLGRQLSSSGQNGRSSIIPAQAIGCFGRDLDGLVQVGALEDVEAGDLVLGLRVRAVGQQHLTVAHPHRGRVARRPGAVTHQPDPLAVHLRTQSSTSGRPSSWPGV
jgi:hypothetical protein